MKNLANLKGVRILGKAQQKGVQGGASSACDGSCSGIGSKCLYYCNGFTYKGICTAQGCIVV
ncbi:hypothetical protein K1F50_12170 [Muricauda oceani]|uniref:Uncharacterized protein n=1 Tax=Flagellimonas oceani TaxID=2698672 RepID=A0A6G7J509_9FLAO|nr:hypothetical protein [Allomuricauda oceani]MBW8243560.1 hypothetical protein [Allomuricauda oceani]QII45770.1 hypothetical protein GVT53_14140 [Allomuricauda oceani]